MTHFATYYRWLVIDKFLGLNMRGEAVLDAGCHDAYVLSRLGAPLSVGVDVQPNASAPQAGVFMVQADAQALPFADARFERVLALELMEHLGSPERFLAEARRLLRGTGELWFSTPSDRYSLSPWFMTPFMENRWGHRRRGFSRAELHALVPADCKITIVSWNEPFFRRLYLFVKLLSLVSSSLTGWAAATCASLDNRFRAGDSGRFFVRVEFDG
jgi:SAM-dependent methyltransferase